MRFFLSIFVLLLCFARLMAQEEAPFPLAKPEEFLAPNLRYEVLSSFYPDNESRTVWYYEPASQQWTSSAYPDGVNLLRSLVLSDGSYMLITREQEPEIAWIFSPERGLVAAESFCGSWRVPEADGEWIRAIVNGQSHLCHTGTGQMTEALGISLADDDDCNSTTKVSEDLLIFYQCHGAETNVFGYRLSSNTLYRYGRFQAFLMPLLIDEENLLLVSGVDYRSTGQPWSFYRIPTSQDNSAVLLFSLNAGVAKAEFSPDRRMIYISENRPSSVQEGDYDGWRLRSYDVFTGEERVLMEHDYLEIQDEAAGLDITFLEGNLLSLQVPIVAMEMNPHYRQYSLYDLNTGEFTLYSSPIKHLFEDYYLHFENYQTSHILRYDNGEMLRSRDLRNLAIHDSLMDETVFYANRYLIVETISLITENHEAAAEADDEARFNFNFNDISYLLYDWESNALYPLVHYSENYAFTFSADTENPNSLIVWATERIVEENGSYTSIFNKTSRWRVYLP